MASIPRRRFLQQSLLGAATVTAVAPAARLLGQTQQAGSPNETLSVAVIGVRGRGQAHAHAFAAREDCRITYICDCDQAMSAPVVKKIGELQQSEPKAVEDMRRVFDDPSVDVVTIATPNHWHSLAAIWAMQAGKDVYVEKPVSHNVSEGRRTVQAARKHQRICQAGTQYRSYGANRAAAKFIAEGKLGDVSYAHCYTYRPRKPIGEPGQFPPPQTLDYNLWTGPAPMQLPVVRPHFHYDWHWIWDYGNGELGNNSVHRLDCLRLILGNPDLGRGVMSYGARQFDDAGQTPNTQVTIHDLGSLTVVQEVRNLATAKPPCDGNILIRGSEGHLVATLTGVAVFDPDDKLVEKLEGPDEDHFDNFIKAVRSRNMEDLNADIVQGHTSTATIHVANISQQLGQTASASEIRAELEKHPSAAAAVETFEAIQKHLADNGVDIQKQPLTLGPWLAIDAEKEQFTGSEAANALLTREYREPFIVPSEDQL